MGANASSPRWTDDPCGEQLDAYIRCATKYGGKEPEEYEEYCESERSLARFVSASAQEAHPVGALLTSSFGPFGRDHLIVSTITNQLKVTKSGKAGLDGLFPRKSTIPPELHLLLIEIKALEREAGDGASTLGIMAAAALQEMTDLHLSDGACVRLARALRELRAGSAWHHLVHETALRCNAVAPPNATTGVAQVAASALQGQFPPQQERALVEALVKWIAGAASNCGGLGAAAWSAASTADRLLVPCIGQRGPQVLGVSAFALSRPPMYRIEAQQGSARTQEVRQARFTVWLCALAAIEARDNAAVYVDSAESLEHAVAYSAARTVANLELLHTRAQVNLLVCTKVLHQVALDTCERLGILVVQSVSESEARDLCALAGTTPIVDTSVFSLLSESASVSTTSPFSRFVGRAARAAETRIGGSICVLIEGIKAGPASSEISCGQVLVHGPTLGLAKEYAASLARAARLVALWAKEFEASMKDTSRHAHHTLGHNLVAVGAAWESALASVLASMSTSASLERNTFEANAVLSVLRAAARAIPLALVPHDARQKLEVKLRRAELSEQEMFTCIRWDAAGQWALKETRIDSLGSDSAGRREPVALKIRQLERLVSFLEQTLRVDALILGANVAKK
ncbi:Hypothetical Protein FCC1311_066932 [Hondaea fermentalgiana]|uniref:Uncharacterized protein n=1 Tax=Hondaea fermentalgiana TaxID=2315210 RepID=A0A2R5GRG3_9STRA|nr:Hypothetical Protein FCC1311_066932 [Hondaea fermentalgiana]|eukprot:GBG30474.1 Hypothetical Protein FCC1311_066932 [Hondaea fermentalgiana]